MNISEKTINTYIEYCTSQKRLDPKTIKAYRIDLTQFFRCIGNIELNHTTANHGIAAINGLCTAKKRPVNRRFHYSKIDTYDQTSKTGHHRCLLTDFEKKLRQLPSEFDTRYQR